MPKFFLDSLVRTRPNYEIPAIRLLYIGQAYSHYGIIDLKTLLLAAFAIYMRVKYILILSREFLRRCDNPDCFRRGGFFG